MSFNKLVEDLVNLEVPRTKEYLENLLYDKLRMLDIQLEEILELINEIKDKKNGS